MSEILISLTGHHKNVHSFFGYSPVFLEICSTHLTLQCLKCVFTWINTRIWLELPYLWKKFQDEMVHEKTFTNKAQYFFLVSSRRYQDFRHIWQNPKVPENLRAPIITTDDINFLMAGPLPVIIMSNGNF